MTSLILEGGSFRAIFTAGVLDGFMENNIYFPYVIGVSGGISNAASYISKQNGRNLKVIKEYRNDKKYAGLNNFFTDKSIFGVEFVFETIPNELIPFDYETFYNYKGMVLAAVTNAHTGKSEYLDALAGTTQNEVFKATCSIPALFEPQKIGDNLYFDGGVSDSIPIVKAMNDKNDKHIIVLTQPKGYKKELDVQTKMAAMIIEKKYPMIAYKLRHRYELYNLQVKLCEKLEQENKAIIIRPNTLLKSDENDIRILENTYNEGKKWVYDNLDKIKNFLGNEKLDY